MKRYDYLDVLRKNDFTGDLIWNDYNVTYDNQSFKKMKEASILSNDKPISNHSPILLIGDSFTMESLQESLAYAFTTQISTISATSASPTMTRILQMREKDIPGEAKLCFFVFYSRYLHSYFTPFISKDSMQLYPDGPIVINSSNFDIEGKDLQKELCIDFSMDLSSYSSDAQSYTLFFYLSSTKQQDFIVTVNSDNSTFRGYEGTRSSGHGVVAVRLTKEALQHPLDINVRTIPYTNGAPINLNKNLLLKIDKILFSHN